MLMVKALLGGESLVIRVGQSTFALRRAEAACIRVTSISAPQNVAQSTPDCGAVRFSVG